MANTTVQGRSSIIVTGLDADWIAGTDSDRRDYYIQSIQFIPSAQNDRMIVHDEGIDGADIFDSGLAPDTAAIIEYYNPPKWAMPVIDISDCTLNSAGDCKVIINTISDNRARNVR